MTRVSQFTSRQTQIVIMKFFIWMFFAASSLPGQTNDLSSTNAAGVKIETNPPSFNIERAEQIRTTCLQGRRLVCGRIIKVLPDGFVVDSGYTDLMREPLNRSWLVPGSAVAHRESNLVEQDEPGAVCVGPVFLTDLPKKRGARPKQYDYIIILGYPAGRHTYTSVGTVRKTVRHFSANLLKAVDLNYNRAEKQPDAPVAGTK